MPSIVDYLKERGDDSSFQARSRLAEQQGIQGYQGSADQNTRLLRAIRGEAPERETTTRQEQTPLQTTSAPSYTVRPGDTLSAIAQRKGVSVGDISGHRSGDPSLIHPGEQLTIGRGTTSPTTPTPTDPVAPREPESPAPWTERDEPRGMVESIRYEIGEAERAREEARERMQNARTDMFNREYEERGGPERKERISAIDNEIAEQRKQRDDAILTAQRNPNISAGVLSGEVQRLTEHFNSQINNSINKRNSVAEEYNTILDEVERRVENQMDDYYREYDHWDRMAQDAMQRLQRYEGVLEDELMREADQSRWERELAQQLEIARMRESSTPTEGGGLIDPETEEVLSEWDVARRIIEENPGLSDEELVTMIRERTDGALSLSDARGLVGVREVEPEVVDEEEVKQGIRSWVDMWIERGMNINEIEEMWRNEEGWPEQSSLPEPHKSIFEEYKGGGIGDWFRGIGDAIKWW